MKRSQLVESADPLVGKIDLGLGKSRFEQVAHRRLGSVCEKSCLDASPQQGTGQVSLGSRRPGRVNTKSGHRALSSILQRGLQMESSAQHQATLTTPLSQQS